MAFFSREPPQVGVQMHSQRRAPLALAGGHHCPGLPVANTLIPVSSAPGSRREQALVRLEDPAKKSTAESHAAPALGRGSSVDWPVPGPGANAFCRPWRQGPGAAAPRAAVAPSSGGWPPPTPHRRRPCWAPRTLPRDKPWISARPHRRLQEQVFSMPRARLPLT